MFVRSKFVRLCVRFVEESGSAVLRCANILTSDLTNGEQAGNFFLGRTRTCSVKTTETTTMRIQSWDPDGERLFTEGVNSTIYQFGYLYRASDLCYWHREHIQATNAIVGENIAPPGCGL